VLLPKIKKNPKNTNGRLAIPAPAGLLVNDVSRSAGEAAEHVSFAELESTMYKRRRRAQPQLPSSPSDADAIVRNSRYAELDGGTFYRGLVNADAHGPGRH